MGLYRREHTHRRKQAPKHRVRKHARAEGGEVHERDSAHQGCRDDGHHARNHRHHTGRQVLCEGDARRGGRRFPFAALVFPFPIDSVDQAR